MNAKKFSIVVGIFLAIIAVTMVVLACVRVGYDAQIAEPTTYVVYAKSKGTGKSYNKENTERYSKLSGLVKNMTSLNIIDYMAKGMSLKAKPSQDYDNKYKWSDNYKMDGYCLELIYDDKQTMIVEIDGNTKVVEYTALFIKVDGKWSADEVAVYFSNSTGTQKSYQENPILMIAKQNKLYKYLKTFE